MTRQPTDHEFRTMYHLSRRPDQRSRRLLAALACLLLYATYAHAGHWHDADTHGSVQSTVCELCVGFDRLIDAPTAPVLRLVRTAPDEPAARAATPAPAARPEPGPRPRAPPLH